jgi:hypothetical protein
MPASQAVLCAFGVVLQVIAVICVLVWIMNINRFSDPALGGWVSGELEPCRVWWRGAGFCQ